VLLERLQAALDDTTVGTTEVATPDAAAEQQRLAELRAQLHWLYNQLMGESGRRHLGAAINRQLQVTEAALQQIEWRQSPLLAQAQAVDLAAFQAVLASDQQAVVYAEINQEVLAFLVDRTSVRIYRRLTTLGALTAAVDEFRFQMGRVEVDPAYVARHSGRLESRLRAALHQLYALLLAPLRLALTAQRLLFVPFGPIHRLPLHALWDGDYYLIETTECSYAPSASLAVFRQARKGGKALHTWTGFAIDDPAIPAARREVERVARHFSQPTTYMEAAANRPNLWQAAAESDILHLATHGLFRPDNPFFSALKMADGWIDVRELYRLPLTARLIVLSACESGVGEIAGGDEVVGLARGFLGAGRDPAGRELIASLWNVHDATAANLMDHFYGALLATSQGRPATALRTAQCQAIAQRQHPYYWAPFFVIGA
jgi:CHAT domain-containing protein